MGATWCDGVRAVTLRGWPPCWLRYWYDVGWAVVAFDRIGDAFLYLLLGHEYAHGIQLRLQSSQPWFAPGAHGDAEQRTQAFFAGYERSVSSCRLSI
jgi:uncharacterized protein